MRGLALECMGEAEFGRGRFGEAINWAKQALKNKATTTDLYLLLGKAYYRQKTAKKRALLRQNPQRRRQLEPAAQRGMELCKE